MSGNEIAALTQSAFTEGFKEGELYILEKLKTEIEEIKMKEPLMSKGFECYDFKDKTPEDIKTEIIEIIENYIKEKENK